MRRASSREPGEAGARHGMVATAGTSAAKTSGLISPTCATRNSSDVEGREAVRRRASELLGESRPAVLGVPGDEGGENRRAQRQAPANSAGETSQRRSEGVVDQGEHDAGGEKGGGELRLQRQPERQPERDQPARLAGAPELDQGRKAKGPEHDERRVGGDENRADKDQRHRDPHQRRERGLFRRAEQAPGDQRDEGRHRADDRGGKAPARRVRSRRTAPSRRG